ncbi:hypothetical protein ACFOY2_35585 [Nonomuraea purpurea]|uniref:Transcriptional regulator n=1 Tax=Nonomuraea purpurea TaxID=1849276 RepID=A0ABV8GHV1_9ACTN
MITVDELRERFGKTWEIATDLALGVAAWRHTDVTNARYKAGLVNVLRGWDLDELAQKLAEQDDRWREHAGAAPPAPKPRVLGGSTSAGP